MSRRQMKPWEVIATLLKQGQVVAVIPRSNYPTPQDPERRGAIICKRSGQEITLENVRRIQVEHWPKRHKHGGEVSPDNAVISLKEGHAVQTKREKAADAKERRVKRDRKFTPDMDKKKRRVTGKPTGWRWKKPIGGGRPVKVPTYE